MPKRVVIGIGGTGLEVIRSLRRRIVETYPELGLRKFPSLGFFYIDTDENAVKVNDDNRKRWEVLGASIELRQSEYITVKAPTVKQVLSNLASYPQLRGWLPIEQLDGLDVAAKNTPGAQQIRPLGRMIYTLNSDLVKRQFTSLLSGLQEDPNGGPTEVILACSLSGGTGAGMFLDVAYSLRRWLQGRGKTTSFLVLPDLMEEARRGRRYLANAYAALMDLNYFSQRSRIREGRQVPVEFQLPAEEAVFQENPFDFCYLIGTHNQESEALSLETLNEMIAHRIMLGLDGAIADDVASMMNNAEMARNSFLTDPKNGNQFAQFFSTFGLSTIQYPTEQITEILAYRLVDQAVKSWLEPPPVDNVNQRIQARLPSLMLTDEHLLGNRDFFGQSQNYPPIPTEIAQVLTDKLNKTPVSHREPYLQQVFSGLLNEFRGGLQAYYQMLDKNREGAADVIVRSVQGEISSALVDAALGYPYAVAAVNGLIEILETKRQTFTTEAHKLPARIKGSALSTTAAMGEVTKAEGKVMFRESATNEAMTKVRQSMEMNLTAQAQDRAYQFGIALIDDVIARLKVLRSSVIDWANNLANLRTELEKEINARAQSLLELQKNTKRFNGAILFRIERVQSIYDQFRHDEAAAFIRDALVAQREAIAWREDPAEVQRECFKAAVEWMTRRSTVRVTDKNVAQQLLEDYPGPQNPERTDLLSRAYRRSAPFLDFEQGEIAIYRGQEGHSYNMDAQTMAHRAALMDHEQNRFKEVAQIRKEILAATTLTDSMVRVISDTQQIVFISELTAFPLRVIKEMPALREAYKAHTRERKALPLHIQKVYEPACGDLMLVSEAEVRARHTQEENFLIGWTLGHQTGHTEWIRSDEENPYSKRTEIRYRYSIAGAPADPVPLGESRDEAFRLWTGASEELQDSRQRLGDAIARYFQKLLDAEQKRAFAGKLYAVLNEIKASLPYGEDNEIYKIYSAARRRIVDRFHLVREGDVVTVEPAAPKPSPVPAAAGAAAQPAPTGADPKLEEFRKYVAIVAAQVKGKLSDKVREKVSARQAALGLPAGTAAAALEEALAKYQAPADSPSARYRDALKDALDIGEGSLSEDAEAELLDMQAAAGIAPEEAAAIERDVRRELKL